MNKKAAIVQAGYSMAAVVQMTGITDHSLRAWERRYAAITPDRTPGGTRKYREFHVVRLRLLSQLVQNGHKIGDLAALPDTQLRRLLGTADCTPAYSHEQILAAFANYNTHVARSRLTYQCHLLGPSQFAETVALPVLKETGDRWSNGTLSIAVEHLTTVTIRSIFELALRSYASREKLRPILVTTPAGELHEIGAMAATIFLCEQGYNAIYLGPNMPAESTAAAAIATHAWAVILGVICLSDADVLRYIHTLKSQLPAQVHLLCGGPGKYSEIQGENSPFRATFDGLLALVEEHAPGMVSA